MSIRDFDPLLKKAAARAAGKAVKSTASGDLAEHYTARTPIKLSMGARNIKISEQGSAAALGRALNAAFTEIARDFGAFTQQLDGVLVDDCAAALEPTLKLAQFYCPKDTETLVNSGYLVVESFRGGARAEIGFAKNNKPPYAIYVHEMPYAHTAPTSDKFLQKAVDQDYFNIIQRMTDRVRIRVGA